jgi:hypothetical protein
MTTPPPPPGWYPDPSGIPGSRYWDGRHWGPTAPPAPPPLLPATKNKNSGRIIGIIGVVVVLIVLGSIESHDKKQATPVGSATATPGTPSIRVPAVPSSKPVAIPAPFASIGQEARDGQFAFTVTAVDRSKVAGDLSNEFEIVTAQGEFLNVHITVANVGSHAQTFFASNQKLKIESKEFSPDGTAAFWTKSADVEINPGNSIQAVVSFDVPPGTSGGTLQLHDSIFSGGTQVGLS